MSVGLVEAVRTRRSAKRLTDPAPDDSTMARLVESASTAPDHGRLRPWRLVLMRGAELQALGQALAQAAADPALADHARSKPLRAPLLDVPFADDGSRDGWGLAHPLTAVPPGP